LLLLSEGGGGEGRRGGGGGGLREGSDGGLQLVWGMVLLLFLRLGAIMTVWNPFISAGQQLSSAEGCPSPGWAKSAVPSWRRLVQLCEP